MNIGILGGGQLGRMLLAECMKLALPVSILDPDAACPAASWTNRFVQGDFRRYADVWQFGQNLDLLTIEIEQVNVAALEDLQTMGKIVHPNPAALRIIQDKGLQKQFYAQHGLPTAPFALFADCEALALAVQRGEWAFPFVVKTRTLGYDGKGVYLLKTVQDLEQIPDTPLLVEQKVAIDKEIAVVLAQDVEGKVEIFDIFEMIFHPTANLLEYVRCPAVLSADIAQKARDLAYQTLKAFDLRGILAVEMFLTSEGECLLNEVAPRPHNSAHSSIEGAMVSQYEQHLRSILGLPLGSAKTKIPTILFNLLGKEGYEGNADEQQWQSLLAIEGVSVHWYGKKVSKPFRKLGHITLAHPDPVQLGQLAESIQRVMDKV